MKRASLMWSNANIMAEKESRIQNLPSEVPRCLEPDHQADFRDLLARHLLQQTTAHNKGQKTTFGSQFITHVLTNLSVNFSQGLRAMTRRFCEPWAKSYSAILQASTTTKLYQISMVWIVTCYQVRSQSLKTTTARMHIREKTQL